MTATTSARIMADESAARPLVWWTPTQCDVLVARLQPVWEEWSLQWVAAPPSRDDFIHCRPPHDEPALAAGQWAVLGTRDEASAWTEGQDDPIARIEEVMFGRGPAAAAWPAASGVARAVAARAWSDLAQRLRDELRLEIQEQASPPSLLAFKPWLGSLALTFPGAAGASINILLNSACVSALVPPTLHRASTLSLASARRDLVRLDQALADRVLPVQVELTGCELDLGSLQGLRAGDIITLKHPLDAPLIVSTADGTKLCTGFLGRQAGSKAVELVREPARPSVDNEPLALP